MAAWARIDTASCCARRRSPSESHVSLAPSFTPLRVRSHGSLLAGVASPEALCERAAELGHAALGLTDLDNLYLAVRFLNAAKGAGLKAIVGAEVSTLQRAVPARRPG